MLMATGLYREEEVRSVNLTRSSSPNCAQRQDTCQDVGSWNDRNICSALSLSACSTTCCCVAFRTVESDDFPPLRLPKQSLHIWTHIQTHTFYFRITFSNHSVVDCRPKQMSPPCPARFLCRELANS